MGETAPILDDATPLVLLESEAEVAVLPTANAPPRAQVPASLLARLIAYAQTRLAAGVGVNLLQAAGLATPGFIDLCAPGVLPSTYRQAIAPVDAALLTGIDLADALLVPAYDDHGLVVDAACWRLEADGPVWLGSLQSYPVGTAMPRLPGVDVTVTLAPDLEDLARRMAAGERHVLLLRPDRPVQAQLRDLQARGLRSVCADQPELAAHCRTVGLTVAATESSAAWQVVAVDRDHRRVVLTAGAVTASLSIPATDSTQLRADLRLPDGRHQGDTFDAAVPRQVQTFLAMAGRKLQVDSAVLSRLFDAGLLDRLRALGEDPQAQTARYITSAPDADACGSDPAIVDRFVSDADLLGWVGDSQAKRLALLTLAGLGLDRPPWLLLQGPSAVTLPIIGVLAEIIPAERQLHLTRATEGSLISQGPDGLRHRLLIMDEAAAVKPATLTALRVLQARGGLAVPVSARDAASGRMTSRLSEARGPVGMLCAATASCGLDALAVVVRLDETPEQTARVQTAARQAARSGIDHPARDRCRARWQGVLAGIPQLPVRVPTADRVQFPARHPRHRFEQDQFLALVEASALLHHQQRTQVDGCLIATDADIALVIDATRGLLGRTDDGLSERARQLVALLAARPDRSITIPQLAEAKPPWTRDVARGVLDELLRAQVVAGPSTGRGRKARPFVLIRMPSVDDPGILLLPPGVLQPVRNWGSPPMAIPNISPVQPSTSLLLGNWGHDDAGRTTCAS